MLRAKPEAAHWKRVPKAKTNLDRSTWRRSDGAEVFKVNHGLWSAQRSDGAVIRNREVTSYEHHPLPDRMCRFDTAKLAMEWLDRHSPLPANAGATS